MKKRNPSSGQNGQLVHWWLLIHSGPPTYAPEVKAQVSVCLQQQETVES
jgi:hypothetical protein